MRCRPGVTVGGCVVVALLSTLRAADALDRREPQPPRGPSRLRLAWSVWPLTVLVLPQPGRARTTAAAVAAAAAAAATWARPPWQRQSGTADWAVAAATAAEQAFWLACLGWELGLVRACALSLHEPRMPPACLTCRHVGAHVLDGCRSGVCGGCGGAADDACRRGRSARMGRAWAGRRNAGVRPGRHCHRCVGHVACRHHGARPLHRARLSCTDRALQPHCTDTDIHRPTCTSST
jgi:hypothetical protein